MKTWGWLRFGLGMALLISPGRVLALIKDSPVAPHERNVARVLGLREVAQALVCAPRPTPGVLRMGVYVDAIHAVTMVGVAAARPKWRRPALSSALTASGFAIGGLRAVRAITRAPRPARAQVPGLEAALIERRDALASAVLKRLPGSAS